MSPKCWLLVVLPVLLLAGLASTCIRRRRRSPPQTVVHCEVSNWYPWSRCSEKCAIGTYERHRFIITRPANGGRTCPNLNETSECGKENGGCADFCAEKDGSCACTTKGYELQIDKVSCADKNECLDGSERCINANCNNTDGSYECKCFFGYQPSSNRFRCEIQSCPLLSAPQCPADVYRDEFGTTCMPVKIICHDGHKYQQSCILSCNDNYKLAVIPQPNSRQKFAENFTTVDFDSPSDRTLCTVDPSSGAVMWDWNPVSNPYYCRRVNDPPLGVTISKTLINEKEPFLTLVGKLAATDPQNDHLIFSIQNAKGNHYFLIQNNTLLVKSRLVWTPNYGGNIYHVVVNVYDNGSPMMHSKSTLYITVSNINDPPYELELSNNELVSNVPVNHIVGNLTAIDDDLGPQRTSNFSWELLENDNGLFSVRGSKIITAKKLNHETKNIHRIQVRCTDFGIPRKSSTVVNMFINVRSRNDCQKNIYLTNHIVFENSRVGTFVGAITALENCNDTISFDLQTDEMSGPSKFALEGSAACALRFYEGKPNQTCSIALVVNGSLDFEIKKEFFIWIIATSSGGATAKKFRIEIKNVNERSTDILITDSRVPENPPTGTVVGEFLVQDPDNKDELIQNHTCSLVNSRNGDERVFYIDQEDIFAQRNLLRVNPNSSLDFETKNIYNITIFCKDKHLGISKSFQIQITDVNEAPTSLLLSNTSVKESRSNMIYIATISAEDPDGVNQAFIYTVRNLQSFRIGGRNKDQLFFLGPLDFERTPSISVHLRVTDIGGLYLEKIFTIMVEDVNDPPTDIILRPSDAKLSENSAPNNFICQLEMIDPDSNTIASCTLENNSNNRVNLISMNLVGGPTITDYESLGSSKSVKILVRCEDQYRASVTRWINLLVEDVNEAPTNLTLSKSEIQENKNDTVVGILTMFDPDVGQRHSCTIVDANTPFYIDSSTNSIKLKTLRPLDFESSRVEYVNIICKDIVLNHGQAQLFIDKQFKINVIDVNEAPQILCNSPFHVLPSFSRGSILGKIQLYDPDNERYYRSKKQNPNGPFEARKQFLNFSIENENIARPFRVAQNGIIYLEKQLTAGEYTNRTIVFEIRIDDDGAVLERINQNSSEKYQIKKDANKYYVQKCSILIAENEEDIDLHLSSNTVPENSTYGTIIIGNLSRRPLLPQEQVNYHIIEVTNRTRPFEIENNILKVNLDKSLDYGHLPENKSIPLTISSVASFSGVFTRQFLITESPLPTEICLISPQRLDNCSVIGHILVEDLDYPDLKCGFSKLDDLEKFSRQLSQYTCHIQGSLDTSNNKNIVNEHFYIEDSPPILYARKAIFTRGDSSYDVPIACRSTKRPLHIISKTLNVNIKVSADGKCLAYNVTHERRTSSESASLVWIIYIFVALAIVALIIVGYVVRKRRAIKEENNDAPVRFNTGESTIGLDTTFANGMYATTSSEKPPLTEKPLQVCLDPAFVNPAFCNDDCNTGESGSSSERPMNHYDTIYPAGVYERLDDGMYDGVQDVGAQIKGNKNETNC